MMVSYQILFKKKYSKKSIQFFDLKLFSKKFLCHNWIWKPILKDGTLGIRPRLDTLALGLHFK